MRKPEISVPELDYPKTVEKLTTFIKTCVKDSNLNGVVMGLSGGVDSSLVATLCVRALGRERVLAIMMPMDFTPQEDVEDAKELAETLDIKTETVPLREIYTAFHEALKHGQRDTNDKIPMANVVARVRMVILYYYANLKNLLVAGTGDRSEILIGFFTKYGDGGSDFLPISCLYKTQVRKLAEYLGVPRRIAYKPSSPRLYPGHKATDELPLEYEKLDPVLIGLFDKHLLNEEVSRLTGTPLATVKEVQKRFNTSKHKRALPLMPPE